MLLHDRSPSGPPRATVPMIALTFALPDESSAFHRRFSQAHSGIAILHTGVGRKVCQERIEPFLDSQPFQFLLSSGFAGGVEPSLGAGDLLLAENFSDPALLARVRALLPLVGRDSVEPGPGPTATHLARLATTDRILDHAAERDKFAREHHAAAVDMETEWIAQACAARKIPLLSLRVISDTAAAPFPAPSSVLFDLERQRTSPPHLLGYLLRHPAAIGRFIRFARQISSARANLAVALDLVLRELGSRPAV